MAQITLDSSRHEIAFKQKLCTTSAKAQLHKTPLLLGQLLGYIPILEV